jgi:hypothetical protein
LNIIISLVYINQHKVLRLFHHFKISKTIWPSALPF